MKENKYLEIINKTLTDSSLIGDDCAFLSQKFLGNSGIYVTQDSLVEGVHFTIDTISPYQLGKKVIEVNISDLCAMCATPLAVTISLSLPANIDNSFIENFYKGVNESCARAGVKVAGGDLTGADKVFVSVTAIGRKSANCAISRSFAKNGDVVLVSGFHGDSAAGLKLLQKDIKQPNSLIKAHLEPEAELEKSRLIAQVADESFAMMDTSDGLADALYKIASSSNVQIEVDFENVPIARDLKQTFPECYKDFVLWGGEDYKLLCCVDAKIAQKLVQNRFFQIGKVTNAKSEPCVIINDNETFVINKEVFSKKSFNHFGE